jgi:hypothetical protein
VLEARYAPLEKILSQGNRGLVTAITAAAAGRCNLMPTLEATMTAALRQTSNFLQRFAKRFQEARQAKAQRVIDEHLRYYRKCHAPEIARVAGVP